VDDRKTELVPSRCTRSSTDPGSCQRTDRRTGACRDAENRGGRNDREKGTEQ
jgi:hypothetical protein